MNGPPRTQCITFTSASSGLGRTAAVANTAMILAGTRARVLIVDWSGEQPSAKSYFERFTIGTPPDSEALAAVLDGLTDQPRGTWRAERFQPPGDVGPIDLVTPTATWQSEAPPGLPWGDPIENIVTRLRRALDESDLGYVLVDAPTNPGSGTIEVVARGADAAVVLFGPGRLAATQASTLALTIRARAVAGVRVLPLQSELDTSGPETSRAAPKLLAQLFEDFLLPGDPQILRIPFSPRQVSGPVLATLSEDPSSDAVRAYTMLAEQLSEGQVVGPPKLSPELRANYRIAVGLDDAQDQVGRFTIAHAWQDRRWADWARAQLEGCGVQVTLLAVGSEVVPEPNGRVVVIQTPALLAIDPDACASLDPVLVLVPPQEPVETRVERGRSTLITTPGLSTGEGLTERGDGTTLRSSITPGVERTSELVLAGRTAAEAALLLLGRLGLVPDSLRARPLAFAPRYPADVRPARDLTTNFTPPPERPFVGREADLAAVRDHLMADIDGCEPYVLSGPPGIGKTGMVLQYLRLFGQDYDLIWWISARTPELTRLGLGELAARRGIPPEGDTARAAVRWLRARERRWLLIYDDAPDLEDLADLLPTGGPGHVLVTSRRTEDQRPNGSLLAPVDPPSGALLLCESVDGLTPEQGAAVAEALQGLPLSLGLAAAWMCETTDWLRARATGTEEAAAWAATEFLARLDGSLRGDRTDVAAACLNVVCQALEEEQLGRLSVRLLEMCAWLAPEGASHKLLASSPFLGALAQAAGEEDGSLVERDSMVLDRLLRLCARYGLAETQWSRNSIVRIHRMLQELMKDRMGSRTALLRRDQTLSALAATVPPEAGGPVTDSRIEFTELQRHLVPAQADQSDEETVRRWVVNQVRFQYASADRGSWAVMVPLAERMAERWPDDLLTGRLLGQISNIHRDLGDFRRALEVGEQALRILHEQGVPGRYWALAAGRGHSGDLRGLGRFTESLGEIQGIYEETRLLLGDDHRDTVIARINLAESAYLMGQHALALQNARAAWRRQVLQFGEDDWTALRIARRVGDYLAELGEYDDARRLLARSLNQARDKYPTNRVTVLELQRSLAVVSRYRTLDNTNTQINEARQGFREELGPSHPSTLAAELSLAIELNMLSKHRAAARVASRCLHGFEQIYGPAHPFVQLCRLDLNLFQFNADGGTAERMLAEAREAKGMLAAALGEQHPWTMAAALHESRALVALGRSEEAVRLDEQTADDALDLLGPRHPYTIAAEDSLPHTRGERWSTRPVVYLDVPCV